MASGWVPQEADPRYTSVHGKTVEEYFGKHQGWGRQKAELGKGDKWVTKQSPSTISIKASANPTGNSETRMAL